ncbi:MAG: hypothetical protein RR875_08405, partial [Clostridium sp.]
ITEEGSRFIQHADSVIQELGKIAEIKSDEPVHRFSVHCMFNHTIVSRAFAKLCGEYTHCSKLDFSILTDSAGTIADDIYMGRCQLGIALMNQTMIDVYSKTMSNKNLNIQIISDLHFNVNMRKEHPLAGITPFPFERLHDYPYVNYTFNRLTDMPDIFAMGLVDPCKVITVSERETRSQAVIGSDAFSIGCTFHPSTKAVDQMYSVKIPNIIVKLVLVYKKNLPFNEETKRFLELLDTELQNIL